MATKSLVVPRDELAVFCKRNQIRDDFGPECDVDILAEFEPEATVGSFKLCDLEEELSGLFGGRRIDINTPKSLSKYFRDEVLREAEVFYVAS